MLPLSIAACLLVACAGQTTRPEDTGPRAKIIFSPPEISQRVTPDDEVSLQRLESNEDCSFGGLGGLRMPFGASRESIEVPAGERGHYRLRQQRGDDVVEKDFSFVPEADREYLIEHIDEADQVKIRFYQLQSNGEQTEVDVDQKAPPGSCE